MRRRFSDLAVVLILSIVSFNIFVDLVMFSERSTTKVCVDPATTTWGLGCVFTIRVNVTSVINMAGWEFYLYWNNTLLNGIHAEAQGRMCLGWNPIAIAEVEQNYNETHGRCHMGIIEGDFPQGCNGSMILARIWFNVTSPVGSCTLNLDNSTLYDRNGDPISHDEHDGTFQTVEPINVTFRLLAIEHADDDDFRSGRHLIEKLTQFTNWKNQTWGAYNYTSYIHLLSGDTDAQSLPYYKGRATRSNVEGEIADFLGQTLPGENNSRTIRILHIHAHGNKLPSRELNRTYWYVDLDNYWLVDWRLDQLLNEGDLAASNCTLVIIGSCKSGGFIQNVSRAGRMILTSCKEDETSYHWSGGPCHDIGYFTGHQNANYQNGTVGPVGIVGGLFNADDQDGDCWISASEVFNFANRTVVDYSKQKGTPFHPQSRCTLVTGEIPLIMSSKYQYVWDPVIRSHCFPANFPYNPGRLVANFPPTLPWDRFGHDNSRASNSPAKGPSTPNSLWNRSLYASIHSSTAVADGLVFVGTDEGKLYAMDLYSGKIGWSFQADAPIRSSPAVVDGRVFFGTNAPGRVYALDEGTGLVRWAYHIPTGADVVSSPAVANNIVLIGSSDGHLYAINQTTGYQIWNFSTAGPILSSPAVSDDMVFFGSYDGIVYALNITNGQPLWAYPTYGPVVSSPAVIDPMIYIASMDGMVYALDEFTGQWQWDFPTGGPVTSSPAVDSHSNLVIVSSQDNSTYALERMSGAFMWMEPVGMVNMSSPAISGNGLVYIGTTIGEFCCLNGTTGGIIWSYSIGGSVLSSPAITDEHVLIGSTNGTIHCFGPPFPIHDVTIVNATVSDSDVTPGQTVEIIFTVANKGNRRETFTIEICYNTSAIWTPPEYKNPTIICNLTTTLNPGEKKNLSYLWDTTYRKACVYTIIINIPSLPYEYDFSDNTRIAGNIKINVGGSRHLSIPLLL